MRGKYRPLIPGSLEWRKRATALMAEEATRPEEWWYISFAEPGKFLGGVFVKAPGFITALNKTRILGINPGGEAKGSILEDPGPFPVDKLLSREEMEKLSREEMKEF